MIGSALIALVPLLGDEQVKTEVFQTSPRNAGPAFGSIQLSKDQIFRNETLEYNVTVAAFGWPLELLNWTVDIQNGSGNLSDYTFATKFNSPQLSNTWFINPASISAGSYRVVLWIKNGSDETKVYKDFEILNNLPVINSVHADKNVIKRGDIFNVTVNATDLEIVNLAPNGGDDNIHVRVHYQNTLGVETWVNAQNLGYGNYSALISTIGMTSPTGVYTCWASVKDYRPSMEPAKEINSTTFLLTVQNNNPMIDLASNLIVNGQNPLTANISVRMGNTINVTITASDLENTVSFILIKLKHYETGAWRNYTMNYLDSPHTLIIDTTDLLEGTWALYFTVIDQDGGSVEPPERPGIEILAEPWTIAGPIVAFIIGMPVGLAIGAALISWRARQKATKKPSETPAEEEEVPPVVEKARKVPSQPERKDEGDEEEMSETEEPDSESKTQMKRKIRRRMD